jgi:hypothetical protein
MTNNYFQEYVYSPEDETENTKNAISFAARVRDKIRKSGKMPRYKLSVQVYICERLDQKIVVTSKCLWDNYVDSFATHTYTGENFYVTTIIWGFYID